MAKKHTTGLDARCRDSDGEIHHKRGDTLIGTLRQTYGADFARGYRSDAKLSTVLASTGTESLAEYLRHSRRGKRFSVSVKSSDISNTILSRTTELFEPALKNLAKK
jgi:hypothetical protein